MLQGINHIIQIIGNAGMSETVYAFCNNFALVVAAVFCVLHARRYRINWFKAFLSTTFVYYWIVFSSQFALWIESGFSSPQNANFVVGFVYAPIGCWLVSKLFRIPSPVMCDFLAAVPLILHAIYRVGCTFAGCCRRYPLAGGIYNPYYEQYLFPVQLLEALISVLIVGYLLLRAKKRKYVADGKSLPIMLTLYGTARFFTEFLHDNEKLVWGISATAFHAIFMCNVGVIFLVVLSKNTLKVKDV